MSDFPLPCPYCNTEILVPETIWYINCPKCGHRLNLESQFAYLRGVEAFTEGQEIMNQISPQKRRLLSNSRDREAMDNFIEAYTALQVAFKSDLAEPQRSLGVEIMAVMSGEFMKRNMVSVLEMSYWSSALIEQNAQIEFDRLKEKLNQPAGWSGFLLRWRWKARQRQLAKAMAELDRKLNAFEKQIQFIDRPRARNKNWAP